MHGRTPCSHCPFFPFNLLLLGSAHQIFWKQGPRLVCVSVHFLDMTPPWTSELSLHTYELTYCPGPVPGEPSFP